MMSDEDQIRIERVRAGVCVKGCGRRAARGWVTCGTIECARQSPRFGAAIVGAAALVLLLQVSGCAELDGQAAAAAAGAGTGGAIASSGSGGAEQLAGVGGAGTGGAELAGVGGAIASSGSGGAEQLAGVGGAGTGGAELAGVGGAIASSGSGGAGMMAAPATMCAVAQVAGTACSDPYGYVFLPDDPSHWCVVCYDWPPPSPNFVPNYRSGCLAPLADDHSIIVQCVASCAPCTLTSAGTR